MRCLPVPPVIAPAHVCSHRDDMCYEVIGWNWGDYCESWYNVVFDTQTQKYWAKKASFLYITKLQLLHYSNRKRTDTVYEELSTSSQQ